MKIKSVKAVYFSPVGRTKEVTTYIAKAIAKELQIEMVCCDFTLPAARTEAYVFDSETLVVFGTPVYAGRVPNKVLPMIQSLFKGQHALAVPVVTFGNRSFDNALIELRNELELLDFHTIAAGAFVANHSFSNVMAVGRPDEEDYRLIDELVEKTVQCVRVLSDIPAPVAVKGIEPVPAYYTPLGIDGKPVKFLKAKPQTKDICNFCGICAKVCPMGSINQDNPTLVEGVCIKCQACVRKCPIQAKYFDDPAFLSHKEMLETHYIRRAESEIFI